MFDARGLHPQIMSAGTLASLQALSMNADQSGDGFTLCGAMSDAWGRSHGAITRAGVLLYL